MLCKGIFRSRGASWDSRQLCGSEARSSMTKSLGPNCNWAAASRSCNWPRLVALAIAAATVGLVSSHAKATCALVAFVAFATASSASRIRSPRGAEGKERRAKSERQRTKEKNATCKMQNASEGIAERKSFAAQSLWLKA